MARFCTQYYKSYRQRHHTPALKPTLAVEKAIVKKKNRLRNMAARQKKINQLAGIKDEEQRTLCKKMAVMKTNGNQYVLIDNVIKDIKLKDQ